MRFWGVLWRGPTTDETLGFLFAGVVGPRHNNKHCYRQAQKKCMRKHRTGQHRQTASLGQHHFFGLQKIKCDPQPHAAHYCTVVRLTSRFIHYYHSIGVRVDGSSSVPRMHLLGKMSFGDRAQRCTENCFGWWIDPILARPFSWECAMI